jgi:hypothetical protein
MFFLRDVWPGPDATPDHTTANGGEGRWSSDVRDFANVRGSQPRPVPRRRMPRRSNKSRIGQPRAMRQLK